MVKTPAPKKNTRSTRAKTFAALKEGSENATLNSQQKVFVRYWAEGESVIAAANKAGYEPSGNYGPKLRHMPHIRKAYDVLVAQFAEESRIKREDVLLGLKESIDMAKLMSEPATMIAGWREIGKLCGYYEPKKIDVNVNVNGSVILENMSKMSDADLLKIINEASAAGVEQASLMLDHDDGDETSPT